MQKTTFTAKKKVADPGAEWIRSSFLYAQLRSDGPEGFTTTWWVSNGEKSRNPTSVGPKRRGTAQAPRIARAAIHLPSTILRSDIRHQTVGRRSVGSGVIRARPTRWQHPPLLLRTQRCEFSGGTSMWNDFELERW